MNTATAQIIQFPIKRIKKTVSDSGLMYGKGLTDNSMKELHQRFNNPSTEKDYRNKALFMIMSRTGLRAKEIVNLKFSDKVLTTDGKTAYRVLCKGGKVRMIIAGSVAIDSVKEYHSFIGTNSDYFFLSLPNRARNGNRANITTRSLQKIVNSWNIQTCSGVPIHPHALRHTVGQKVFDKSGSISAQKILGHSNPQTTSKFYTKPFIDCSEILVWD